MPRIVRGSGVAPKDSDVLLQELIEELKKPRDFGQPIILEDRTPETHSVRIHVVWDRWEGRSWESRSAVIERAYRELGEIAPGEQLTMSIGVTVPEASRMGLLPFKLLSARRRGESPPLEQCRRVLEEAGASLLESPEHPQLRCPTLDAAEAAMEHLEAALPGSRWIIAQEVAAPGEF